MLSVHFKMAAFPLPMLEGGRECSVIFTVRTCNSHPCGAITPRHQEFLTIRLVHSEPTVTVQPFLPALLAVGVYAHGFLLWSLGFLISAHLYDFRGSSLSWNLNSLINDPCDFFEPPTLNLILDLVQNYNFIKYSPVINMKDDSYKNSSS